MIRLCALFFICVCYIEFLSGTLGSKVLTLSNIPRFGEDDNTTDRCNDLLNEFATQSSKFSLCAVVHARPIHLCQRCVNQYKNVSDVYSLIQKANNSKGEKCGEVLLNSDRLGVVKQVYFNVQDLWNRGHCQSCFNLNETTGEYQLSSNTLNFIELHSATMACINNHPRKEDSETSTVCGDCEKDYCALNEFYNKLKNLEDDAVCMDTVDTMNQTRILWSDELKCIKRQTAVDLPLILTSSFVSLIPVLFYVGAKLFSNQIRNNPIQAQKRLSAHYKPSTSEGSQ